ncbi:MAG TPA: ATP-binding protein [Cyclobacteriaceae bacterium]|jgi:predicted AAA+ superfamily ATPase|nr:ATP-binding protein [Cytophagales bacterium]HNT49346.1 ATP-binding protein [Cyclobacteriaceae bacterium]HRE65956.1 ATP-binding protein [Cyclobacteriaceae bacterium]HRF33928.1 ATP-binding protein [Cyclobacteriaceae bacterium]
MIARHLAKKITSLRKQFPVLSLTGPRQTGKTTLLKSIYKDLPYITLEDIDNRTNAIQDPRGFLSNFPNGVVLDEVQNTPDLFSYIQGIVDDKDIHVVLSGSQNFLLSEKINQSLAGRTAILKLLPFSFEELKGTKYEPKSWENFVFNGGYPRLYDKQIQPADFYPAYINTYIEKDVRQIKNIENLNSFSLFLKLCAGRTGQVLNIHALANDASVSPNTAKAWLSVLEASYIIHFLQPHHKNYNKRLIKSPKLYFYDTGVVCALLGIESPSQLITHYLKGSLFENFIINEFIKQRLNDGKNLNTFYWLSKDQKEIDLLIDQGNKLIPIEIKSGQSRNASFFSNLLYWQKLSGADSENLNVIYGGTENMRTSTGNYISWKNSSKALA